MASVTVIVWQITDSYDSPHEAAGYAVGNYIHCILDDVALTLSVQLRNAPGIGQGTLVASPVSGPQLFSDGGISNNTFAGTPTPQPFWSRCDGTTLQRISPNNLFPYASIGSTPNASQCAITPVCDLTISDAYSVTPASGPSTPDGTVTVSATSSNGTIHYSLLEGFDYASGQASGTFSNLVPGSYTVYAKDPIGCTDEIDITIPVTETYGVHHRFEYDIVSPGVIQSTRIDIEERAYAGAIEGPDDERLGAPPFILRYEGDVNNKYHPVWYGNAVLTLLSITNLQWAALLGGDDKKYRVKMYRFESGDWQIKYQGFPRPALYSEPYLNPKFYTSIEIRDNMNTLKEKDFVDDDGNELRQNLSQIFIIATILRKTNMGLSIRSCINILEESHDATDDDDVLAQTYVDARIFYDDKGEPDDCESVLAKILEPYGAYIKQALGYFWILRAEASTDDIAYREFDSDGEFVESGTFESSTDLVLQNDRGTTATNFIFRDAAQILKLQRNYGKFTILHDLMPDNNLIDSGSFELQYITETGGQLGFLDWNVFVAQAGLRYGFEAVKHGDSKGAFYFDLDNANVPQADNILYSKKLRVQSSVFDFSFDYYVEPEFSNFPFVRIAYQVKAAQVGGGTTYYLDSLGRWDSSIAHVNDVYVTSYKSWQQVQIRIPDFNSVHAAGYDVEVSFFAHNHYGADAADTDFSDLRDISTVGQFTLGKRVYYYDQTATVLRAYTLKQSFETESLPDRVRGTDYSSPSNQKVWFLDASLDMGPNQSFVRKVLIDNVVFTQLVLVLSPTTYYTDAPNPARYDIVTDPFNINEFEQPVTLGDAPSGSAGAIDATIPNPEVYRSWLKLSDGTPTVAWARRGVTESRPLLDLLLNDKAAQMRVTTKQLVGTLLGNSFLSPVHSLIDAIDDKRYTVLEYELDDKQNSYRVTLAEIVTEADGTIPELAGFTEGFTLGFNA